MAVKIKLARYGKIREPFYRVVVADARTSRNGRAIELVGRYQPKLEPSLIEINSERVQYWLGVGAQPTEAVLSLLKVTGDWQKFKGLPGAEGTLRLQPEKTSKKERYEAALAAIGGDDAPEPTAKKKSAKNVPTKAADESATQSEKRRESASVKKSAAADSASESKNAAETAADSPAAGDTAPSATEEAGA